MNLLKNIILTLKRYTTSAVLNIIGLSLAFTACFVLFIQVNYEYGYDRYNPDADRCYRVAYFNPSDKSTFAYCSQPLIDKLITIAPQVQAATMYDNLTWNKNQYISVTRVNGGIDMFHVDMSQIYSGFVEIAALNIIEGDAIKALNNPYTFLIPKSISEYIFQKESAVGKSFTWLGRECTVGAVYDDIPSNSIFDNNFYYARSDAEKFPDFARNFEFLVKLDKSDSQDDVKSQFDDYLAQDSEGDPVTTVFTSFEDMYYDTTVEGDIGEKGNRTNTLVMLAVAILILMIATINYINFASALTPVKIKMINTQRILGASVMDLRLSIIMESVLLSLTSFVTALLFVTLLSTSIVSSHFLIDISPANNLFIIVIVAIISIIIGLIAGVFPAFYMTSIKPILVLKGSFGMSPKGKVYRSILVGIQYVISFALIICTIFINLQNKYMSNYYLGYDKDQILVVKISEDIYSKHKEEIINEIKTYNNFEDVAFAASKIGDQDYYQGWRTSIDNQMWDFSVTGVSSNFLDVMGMKVDEGRNFREEDANNNYAELIFNRITPKVDGSDLKLDDGELSDDVEDSYYNMKVIGFLSDDVVFQNLHIPELSFCLLLGDLIEPNQFAYIRVKRGSDMNEAINDTKEIFKKIDPIFPVEIEFLNEQLNSLYKKEQRTGLITAIASILAIIISLVGVFGLVLFETQYRRKEIGVRRIHGATVSGILSMFNWKFIRITLICFVIAVPIAIYAISDWVTNFEYKIGISWWIFICALCIVILITVLTVTVRCWAVSNSNPVESLKTE